METIKICVHLKDNTNILITKESYQDSYGGYIWAEGFGLSDDLLHICENEIFMQNTRLGQIEEKETITSLKMLLNEILVEDTKDTSRWEDDVPWDDIEVSDGLSIENMTQLIERIGLISNISKIEASQEYIDEDELLETDDPYSTSMSETIDFSVYRGNL